MSSRIFFFLLAVACSPRADYHQPTDTRLGGRVFTLEISEYRTDRRISPGRDEMPPRVIESVLTLYGRVEDAIGNGSDRFVVFRADSIKYDSRQPYVFKTFMSADTLYYSSPAGQSEIDRVGDAAIDSVLSCVFVGPALTAYLSEAGNPDSTEHANEDCRSGQYERINAPVTLCAFLMRQPIPGKRWRENRVAPSFSGIGYYPGIDLLYRPVKSEGNTVTIAVSADSTIENLTTRMKNGEEIVIVRDRFRVGGSLSITRSSRLPYLGELRIHEELTLVRPNSSGNMLEREGEYRIRFSLP